MLTLRSDFEPQFAAHTAPGPMDILPDRRPGDDARRVPRGDRGAGVGQGALLPGQGQLAEIINRLIGDVANTPGALPLLSFTLSELYRRYLERRGDDRSLREDDYVALGGVGGSLRNRANEVYQACPTMITAGPCAR